MTMPTALEPIRLNYGCGDSRVDGYVGIDVRSCRGADHVLPAWNTSPFEPDSVSEIYSRHMLEHLGPQDLPRTLRAWLSILRPGGVMRAVVPDLAFHARQLLGELASWTQDPEENLAHALAGFYGWHDPARGGANEDAHRWGYTWETLSRALGEAGYVFVQRIVEGPDSEPWHLQVTAAKPEGVSVPYPSRRQEGPCVSAKGLPQNCGPGVSPVLDQGPKAGQSVTAEAAQQRMRAVLGQWRGPGNIAVFGAGAHTRKVLPALEKHADKIATIVDDSPQAWGKVVGRWTVVSPHEGIDESIAAIVVSSDVQQVTLEARIRQTFGHRCAVLTLYLPAAGHDEGPTLSATGERQTGRTVEEIELGHRARYYWALQHLPAGAAVLDAACGCGYGSHILAEGGLRVLGVDVSEDAIGFARHYHYHDRLSFEVGAIDNRASIRRIATDFSPLDAVVSLETIEHLEHPEEFLRTAFDLLVSGGSLFCSTPNAEVMSIADAPFHRRHFTLDEMLALLADVGFRSVQWYGQEGLQILEGRCTGAQRYQLYRALKPG
jgi:predicted SAM-dependent methyltransferase